LQVRYIDNKSRYYSKKVPLSVARESGKMKTVIAKVDLDTTLTALLLGVLPDDEIILFDESTISDYLEDKKAISGFFKRLLWVIPW